MLVSATSVQYEEKMLELSFYKLPTIFELWFMNERTLKCFREMIYVYDEKWFFAISTITESMLNIYI